ncbi:MAG: YfhO family protein [Lachnospiraceae bacterium]|nr:YfhO family protein [Lachnospiraceae bacterium]
MKKWYKLLKKSYWSWYIIGFAVFAITEFHWYLGYEKSLVWSHDGQNQHIVALMYYSGWLRDIVRHLIYEHSLSIPLWDMAIGYGNDVITTLHYYVLGDPLNLLAVFVPTNRIETLYNCLILLRVFLAGITFSIFSLSHKNGKRATLIGSYMYAFSGFMMYFAVRHPYFATPLIYLPLMLLGADKIYKKEKPYLFILSTALAAMSNFYFCYMLVIFTALYVLIRYKKMAGSFRLRVVAGWVGRFAAYGITALLLAATIFLPVSMAALGTTRVGLKTYIPILFPVNYYQKLVANFIQTAEIGYSNRFYMAVPALLALLLILIRKGNREFKAAFAVMLGLLLIPFAGHVMNGFSYVTYRCSFGMTFLLAYGFVKMFREFTQISMRDKRRLTVGLIVYDILLLLAEDARSERVFCAAALAAVCLAFVWIDDIAAASPQKKSSYYTVVFLGMTLASVGFSAYYMLSPQQGDYVSEFVDRNKATGAVSGMYRSPEDTDEAFHPYDVLREKVAATDTARTQLYDVKFMENSSMIQRYYSTQFYWSTDNPYIDQFFREVCFPRKQGYRYKHLDRRSYFEAAANVRYFISKQGKMTALICLAAGRQSAAETPIIYMKQKIIWDWCTDTTGTLPEPSMRRQLRLRSRK